MRWECGYDDLWGTDWDIFFLKLRPHTWIGIMLEIKINDGWTFENNLMWILMSFNIF